MVRKCDSGRISGCLAVSLLDDVEVSGPSVL